MATYPDDHRDPCRQVGRSQLTILKKNPQRDGENSPPEKKKQQSRVQLCGVLFPRCTSVLNTDVVKTPDKTPQKWTYMAKGGTGDPMPDPIFWAQWFTLIVWEGTWH